ncbi:MAG: oligopeptide transporter, OPT family [Deltaproteobacteria bacterium]|jgi:putative OPT family oligopeptide transporter
MSGAPDEPHVPASANLPEITLKAVILGLVLSALLSAANAYLGLFAGLTVSASIPAAVISMAVLKVLGGNILENNIVQTAASAGESMAAGVIFTIPALVILGTWAEFDYWETTMIAGFGGLLGVLFTIPLRRALIVETPLEFPEGVATAEVLKVGESGGGGGIKHIFTSGAIGALFKLGESGLRLWHGTIEEARYAGSTILYFGSNLSPALVAVGYIVGLEIAVLVFIGGALNWLVAIPILAVVEGVPEGVGAVEAAGELWSTQTRYLGVGSMVVGGLWALVSLRKSLVAGVRSSFEAYRRMRDGGDGATLRTERDMPMQWVGAALVFSLIPLGLIFFHVTGVWWVAAIMSVVMLIAGFLFSAVAGYMAGLVGSSNNPISGVTIATILTSSLMLLALLGRESKVGPAAAILIGSVVCCAAAIAGDNMQDLKAGRIVGATPFKQQIMQVVGVLGAAVVAAPILTLLLEAYGIGVPTEAHPDPLRAPQATLMASVAEGVFAGGLPWTMVAIGMVVAVAVIALDQWLARRGSTFRTPVLAVAVGIYLPFELSVPILVGGLVAHLAKRAFAKRLAAAKGDQREAIEEAQTEGSRNGLLFGAGLITGEALVGIAMAVPIVLTGDKNVLAVFGASDAAWPGAVLLGLVVLLTYRVAAKAPREAERP